MAKPVYFAIADRQLECLLDTSFPIESNFERSLILNVLFQSQILIPDIFCFISRGLASHIRKCQVRKSLFEACIGKGVLVPAFRDLDISSFTNALYVVQGRGDPSRAILGILDNANDIARRLDAVTGSGFAPRYWPTHDVGEKYDQVIERHLMSDEPPEVDESTGIDRHELRGIWKLTEGWRTDCILEAREQTRKIAGKGLRRGSIIDVVGKSLGLPKDHVIQDMGELFLLPQTPQEKRAIKLFSRWVTECYEYNQAVEFGCTASFPAFNALDSLMAVSVLPYGMATSVDPGVVPTIQEEVLIPPLGTLLDVSPNELLDLREDKGLGYFAALADWQAEPTDMNAQEVRRTLREYTDELVIWAAKERDFVSAVMDVTHVAETPRNRQMLATALDLLEVVPVVGNLIVLFEKGFTVFQISRPPRESHQIELAADQRTGQILPEVNIPEPKGSIVE